MTARFWISLAFLCSPVWAEWEAIGPFGGSAAVIQVDRHHHGRVLAATSNAQLFRSDNDGGSWRALPFPAELRANLHSFLLDPHNPGVYFIGLASDNPEYSGVFRSTDNGTTWKHLPGLRKDVWALALWRDSRLMAAGTIEGVYLSHDAGETWEHAGPADAPQPQPVVSIAFDQVDPKIIYAGTPHLPWKTTTNGATWESIHEGMLDDSDVFSILIDAWHRQTLFVSVCGGMYRSTDSGEKWKALTKAEGASSRTYHITQNPLKPSVMLAGTTFGLVKSVDSGTHWRRLSDVPTRYIAFDPVKPERIFVATDSGLYRSDDLGETMHPINRGFTNRRVTALAAIEGKLYVNTQEIGGTKMLRLAGSDWEIVPEDQDPPLEEGVGILPMDDRSLLKATAQGLMRSADNGKTWQPVTGVLGQNTVSSISTHPSRSGVAYASQYGSVFVTQDNGQSWSKLAPGDESGEGFRAMLVQPGKPDRLLGVTRSRGVYSMPLP